MFEDLVAVAFSSGELVDAGRKIRFTVQDIGKLVITSGAVAATDPLVAPATRAFPRAVPSGTHRVVLAMAGADVAFARVVFSEAPVRTWEMATWHADVEIGEDQFIGYPVDAGTGSFMDPRAGELLAARMNADEEYFMALVDEMEAHGAWANVRPSPAHPENVVCFASGYGDGVYPSYFGLAEDGSVCALVTDFLVLTGNKEAPPLSVRPPRMTALVFARDVLVWAGLCGMIYVAEGSWRLALALGSACFGAVRTYAWFEQAAAADGSRRLLAVRVAGWVATCAAAAYLLGWNVLAVVIGSIAFWLVHLASELLWES